MTTATTFRPPPLPPQLGQRISSCDFHPDQPVTGFCASCLRERLAKLDPALHRRPATGKPPSASGKSTSFRPQSNNNPSSSSSASLLPELRRCKSFSFSSHCPPPPAAAFEPQRRSCDVRVRGTLWSLFNQEDDGGSIRGLPDPSSSTIRVPGGEIEVQSRNLGFPPLASAAPVEEEEEEEFHEAAEDDPDEIRPVPSDQLAVEERGEVPVRPTKEHIDLDAPAKKPPSKDLKEIAGSFWLAASVFSKKLQNWRRKQKLKKQNAANIASNGSKINGSSGIRKEKMSSTQSEMAVDVFGRRSCDTDPRFSLDAGRMSFDDPRLSWDEPRASWDGYLIGGRSVFPRLQPTLSVVEDAPSAAATVQRLDELIPVEEHPSTPGGLIQTRDYYSDSSQRRRSLDRSSSIRKPATGLEIDEPKPLSNAKVSPAVGNEFVHHVNKLEREFRDSNSLRDDHLESFGPGHRNNVKDGEQLPKKANRWSKAWNIWGLIHRLSNGRGGGGNGVERSLSESWPDLRRGACNGGRMLRSNSNVSSRHSFSGNGGAGITRRNGSVEANGYYRKRRDDFALERNRSARYSPSHLDNGLLRFYLTPMRSSRHGGSRMQKNSHSFTRSVLRLY